jgi:hypothetical protein
MTVVCSKAIVPEAGAARVCRVADTAKLSPGKKFFGAP